jgi:hypothetical protein
MLPKDEQYDTDEDGNIKLIISFYRFSSDVAPVTTKILFKP